MDITTDGNITVSSVGSGDSVGTITAADGREYSHFINANQSRSNIEGATATVSPSASDIDFDKLEFTLNDGSTGKFLSGSFNGDNIRYLREFYFDPNAGQNGEETSEHLKLIRVKGVSYTPQ